MPYFSRLTDIVTCNLSSLLQQSADPRAALEEIILEMREGVAGAQRSVKTAHANVARLEEEIRMQTAQVEEWVAQARSALEKGDESAARQALFRKQEVEDLIAGLQQQLQAAIVTRDHLTTTQHALEARLADALRRRSEMDAGAAPLPQSAPAVPSATPPPPDRLHRVEEELSRLRQELKRGPAQ